MEKEENKLEELKQDYTEIQKKYSLPDFEKLNQDFHIEKISETQTDYIIREVRRFMADKFSNYMRFIENILNPVNVPMFVFSVVKAMTIEDKKNLSEAYKELAKIEIDLLEVDAEFSEEKEAQFVKDSYATWQDIKKIILKFAKSVKSNWENKTGTNDRGYFG